jgi:hypothetical protein
MAGFEEFISGGAGDPVNGFAVENSLDSLGPQLFSKKRDN